MKIKIHSLAVDGPQCGTFGGAFATEAGAYRELLHQLGEGEASDAHALLAAGKIGELCGWITDTYAGSLTTWTIDENEIEFPGIMPLPLKPGFEDGDVTTSELKNCQVPAALWDDFCSDFYGSPQAGHVWMYAGDFLEQAEVCKTDNEILLLWLNRIVTALSEFDGDLCFFKE